MSASLIGWGGLNAIVGHLVLTGVIRPDGGYDRDGMIGHAWIWDALFLAWGVALAIGLWRSRIGHDQRRRSGPGRSWVGDMRSKPRGRRQNVSMPVSPPPSVLRAFGASGEAELLDGGQGSSWRIGSLVLKPDVDPMLQKWLGSKLTHVDQDGFRLAEIVPTRDGDWVFRGWGATAWLPGLPTATDWRGVIDAGRAFHAAMSGLAVPTSLATRSNWWSVADRAVWAEELPDIIVEFSEFAHRLRQRLSPGGKAQLIHGDLTGNVLFAQGRSPAVIDVSPYWRPTGHAEGIVVADALCWHDAPLNLPSTLGIPASDVASGLLFRVLTSNAMQHSRPDPRRAKLERERYLRAIEAIDLM